MVDRENGQHCSPEDMEEIMSACGVAVWHREKMLQALYMATFDQMDAMARAMDIIRGKAKREDKDMKKTIGYTDGETTYCAECGERHAADYGKAADEMMDAITDGVQECYACGRTFRSMSESGAAMGRAKSPAKAASSKANGAKGGRPMRP